MILDIYYQKRGWTKDGQVPDEKITKFNDALVTG
jgi:hypothetical protein